MSTRESFRDRFRFRRVPVVALVAYVIALFAWVAVIGRRLPMPGRGMDVRMAGPGAPEAIVLSNGPTGVGLYLAMWDVMMIAMMYPSSVPLFRLYYRNRSRRC